jgi:hypothetical protein
MIFKKIIYVTLKKRIFKCILFLKGYFIILLLIFQKKISPKSSYNLIVLFTKSLTETPINFLKFFENVNLELNKHFSPKDSTV